MNEPLVHRWQPIESPLEPGSLASDELAALQRMWAAQRKRLESSGAYRAFWERFVRRWSIETGYIERVYDLSAGATELLVERGFDANLIHHEDTDTDPERLVRILEDHRQGMSMVMDLIGGVREFTLGWIKELHILLCRSQLTVTARTPLGDLIEVPFEHGVYKKLPNNPTLQAGVHEYCPPEHVASEMERLVASYHELSGKHPEVRAAWLHHAFTQIHPFQDGNGRVARALASIDFIRAGLFPLVVDRSQRDTEYMPALRAADRGDLRPLVRLFAECQQHAVLRALSEADMAIQEAGTLRTVLEAARVKLEARRTADVAEKTRMAHRIHEYADLAVSRFEQLAAEVNATLPDVRLLPPRRSRPEDEHYWRRQIVDAAKARGYFADLREPRSWARLRLEDGGLTDLVVALHFVGNPSPGSCTATAFLVHRDREEKGLDQADWVVLPSPVLLLAPEEDEAAQRDRFRQWPEPTIVLGLAEWKKRL